MDPGVFPQGSTLVEYLGVDESGNTASCNLTITVQSESRFFDLSANAVPLLDREFLPSLKGLIAGYSDKLSMLYCRY